MDRKPSSNKRDNRDVYKALSAFSQIGITMAACVLIGVFTGRYFDDLLGTTPWLLLLFSLLGAAAAFKSLIDLGTRK